MLCFLLLQVGVWPVSFPRRAIMDQFGAHGSRPPDPRSFRILGCEFGIAAFWPIPMPHVLLLDLERTDVILLLEPPSQAYPDVLIQFVKGSGRVDCAVVASPASYQRIDRL